VGPGYDQNLLVAQELVVQDLGQRGKGDTLIENVLQLDIAARDHITDDDQVRTGIKIRGGEGLVDRNAE
jgi:hypothetical protein